MPGYRLSSPLGQRMSDPLFQSGVMRTQIDRCEDQELNEIDGYLELGMEGEALKQIRVILAQAEISCDEFCTCVFALLQSERPEPRKEEVENAFRRLDKPVS